MKAGLLFLPWLLRWLDGCGRAHPEPEILLNPDEEKGSPGSGARIRAAAAAADVALVLEPATPLGQLKLARKGSGEFTVDVTGRPAHQCVAPEEGVNAVVEAAHQVLRMLELQDAGAGTTVGPNIISGGSASNTVADHARIVVDVRAWTEPERRRLDAGHAKTWCHRHDDRRRGGGGAAVSALAGGSEQAGATGSKDILWQYESLMPDGTVGYFPEPVTASDRAPITGMLEPAEPKAVGEQKQGSELGGVLLVGGLLLAKLLVA